PAFKRGSRHTVAVRSGGQRGSDLLLLPVAEDDHIDLLTGAPLADEGRHLVGIADLPAVDADDRIAGAKSGLGRGAALHHLLDAYALAGSGLFGHADTEPSPRLHLALRPKLLQLPLGLQLAALQGAVVKERAS